MKKLTLILGFLSLNLQAACDRPWLFFDLGENTLVYTDGRDAAGDLVDMHYVPGVRDYLRDLRAKGYPVNLIVNIPGGWGVQGLVQYITRPGGWTPGAARFDWNWFPNIIVPLVDDNRKPQHSDLPFAPGEVWLYREAMKKVPAGCPVLYQTGIKEEVLAAESQGMTAMVRPLLSEDRIERFIKDKEREVRNAMEAQRRAEAAYAARGLVIPRRVAKDATE